MEKRQDAKIADSFLMRYMNMKRTFRTLEADLSAKIGYNTSDAELSGPVRHRRIMVHGSAIPSVDSTQQPEQLFRSSAACINSIGISSRRQG